MPERQLTNAQRMTLLSLMIKASPLPLSFISKSVTISLDKAKRDELVDRKLITVDGKPMVLELTEKGWARAIEELDADLPPRAGAMGGTLYLLLGFIREYLDRNDLSAAEFFTAVPPAPVTDVAAALREAYAGLAARPGDYVMLEDLRRALPGVTPGEVDAALLELDREPDIHLVPESNQKVLTPGQRAAAFRIGNQDMHLLAVHA